MSAAVGVVGLGQMGGPIAAHLVAAGFEVVGFDVAQAPRQRLESAGGRAAGDACAVAAAASTVITSLPSAGALTEVLSADDGLLAAGTASLVVVETSTLALDVKEAGRAACEAAGAILLDCPLSGTGAQARELDLVVLGSGDREAYERCVPALAAFSRSQPYLGPFGAGSKMKYLANLLVAVHNVAAAEALVLAEKAGIDPAQALEVLASGAGSSRMLEVRGPAMAAGAFDGPGIRGDVFLDDVEIIGAFAAGLHCPVPLFSTSAQIYHATVAAGRGHQDTAAVHAVLRRMAGLDGPPGPPGAPG